MTSIFNGKAERAEAKLIADLSELIKFPSVSPAAEHGENCSACANFLVEKLRAMGFSSRLLPTEGNPLVYGEFIAGSGKPTVVYYGHYDVQLPGKERWDHGDPFEAKVVVDRIYGRGAQDNKGQTTFVLNAFETLIAEGGLNCNVRMLLEGEEETGSEGLTQVLPQISELLRGDILLVCDTDAPALGRVGISLSLRGIAIAVFSVHGPAQALHSGIFGGVGPNPIDEASKIVASFHNPDGTIAIGQFNDKVRAISPHDVSRIMADAPTDAELRTMTGWSELQVTEGIRPQVAAALRPAVVTTFITSGDFGQNAIPASTTVRVAARVVPDQDPEEALNQIERHVRDQAPKGVKLEFGASRHGPWLYLNANDPSVTTARKAIRTVSGSDAGLIYSGGSIPVVAQIQKATGATPLLLGLGLLEDNIHNRNESFSIQQMKLGYAAICELLSRL